MKTPFWWVVRSGAEWLGPLSTWTRKRWQAEPFLSRRQARRVARRYPKGTAKAVLVWQQGLGESDKKILRGMCSCL